MDIAASDILGKDVISIAEGERLGDIARVYAHRTTKVIVGFGVDHGTSWREPDRAYRIDAEQIVSLGPDVLTIPNRDVLGGKVINQSFHELEELASVAHRRILTDEGHYLGDVEQITIRLDTLKLTKITVSGGRGRASWDIPIDEVVTLGTEVLIVRSEGVHKSEPEPSTETHTESPPLNLSQRKDTPMNNAHVSGISVISIADGEKIGTVTAVHLALESRTISRLDVGQTGGLLTTPQAQWTLNATDIHAIGPDAITVADRSVLREGPVDEATQLTRIDALTGRKVLTEGGTYVGTVASIEFDEQTRALTGLEASPGFFKANRMVPIDQVVNLGHEIVIVADEVCANTDPMTDTVDADQDKTTRRDYQRVVGDIQAPTRSDASHKA